ncbi:M20/M25/M40 family metallo-hydrolase [Sporolactobacillus terrae]|uniref:Arginine utilization protein RocB n=1 Tax=Sporolactobacillus terrae TaxID=269673 RepID=A0ABX5Q815_9BACL|nr:M20/M25/M40 family metallo-hydrolase [Sporolactobacillus terrae]QAA22765.1 hypothetical protein C0674_09070 [Sporolactobacillus terrae]QAA25738.1 hypothetical protein C0679_09050 [Sporolactobacillus terrae]UAK17616.1 M20/M25/M40 family metallo-hydrolase [Sporolactobacillus terrae]
MAMWQTKEAMTDLLCEMVRIPSISGSQAEKDFPELIIKKLSEMDYFLQHPDDLQQLFAEDGRSLVSAFVRAPEPTAKTVILFSHFDVVDIKDFGKWQDSAFEVKALTQQFYREMDRLPQSVREDLASGHWLFGRGSMDMKSGLAVHLSLLEMASQGAFSGNLLFISVPDEEANSVGMRAAVPHLLQLKNKYNLDYRVALNSEPMFSLYPGDDHHYIYTGSIGKIMPGFLCCGKETHVGEPFSGLNSNLMASLVTAEIELNTDLCDQDEGKPAPPPTNLIQKGLKSGYSVQTPHHSVTLFNLFLLERSIAELSELLLRKATSAARKIEARYHDEAEKYAKRTGSSASHQTVRVQTFDQLIHEAERSLGKEKVAQMIAAWINQYRSMDDRGLSILIVDQLAAYCNTLAPMIILFYAPPFYPAVQSHHHQRIQATVKKIQDHAQNVYRTKLIEQHYFSGISDLSYIGVPANRSSMDQLRGNMPLWNHGYSIPFTEIEALSVPVLNLGPVGRDPHQWTERLDVDFAFGPLKELLIDGIHELFKD